MSASLAHPWCVDLGKVAHSEMWAGTATYNQEDSTKASIVTWRQQTNTVALKGMEEPQYLSSDIYIDMRLREEGNVHWNSELELLFYFIFSYVFLKYAN